MATALARLPRPHECYGLHGSDVGGLVSQGLTATPKRLPPVLLYDARGSRLFEAICELDEYYLTRTERVLLERHAAALASSCPRDVTVVDLGSGNSRKTEALLRGLFAAGGRPRYVPVDVSPSALAGSTQRLARTMPHLPVHPVAATYDEALAGVVSQLEGPALLVFLGSNLGNLSAGSAQAFLRRARVAGGRELQILLGLDMVKPSEVLLPAYDDALGVTAQFNLNLLRRINRELDGDFSPSAFEHVVRWVPGVQRIEMHLRSVVRQRVRIDAIDLEVEFQEGETIHTESSQKYTEKKIDLLAALAGWRVGRRWMDPQRYFSVNLLETVP